MSKRQVWQSIGQFAIIFFTGMLVYDKVPTSLDQIWQPAMQGIVGALGVFGLSRVPTR